MSRGRNKKTSLLQYCRWERVVVRTRVAKEEVGNGWLGVVFCGAADFWMWDAGKRKAEDDSPDSWGKGDPNWLRQNVLAFGVSLYISYYCMYHTGLWLWFLFCLTCWEFLRVYVSDKGGILCLIHSIFLSVSSNFYHHLQLELPCFPRLCLA